MLNHSDLLCKNFTFCFKIDFLIGLGMDSTPAFVFKSLSLNLFSLVSVSLILSTLLTSSASLEAGSKSDLEIKCIEESYTKLLKYNYLQ